MPSSLYLACEGTGGERSDDPGEMPLEKRIAKVESEVVEELKPVVDLDAVADMEPVVGKVRRAPSRSSTRIATLASRQPVQQEVRELSPSPQRVRKRVKVATKVTVKQEKKVKVVKSKKEAVKAEKKEVATEVVAAVTVGSDVGSQGEDDPGEVAEQGKHAGTGKHGHQAHQSLKISQQLADRAGLNDSGKVKATIRIFNFTYLESIQEEDKRAMELLVKIEEAGGGKRPSKRPDLKAVSKMLQMEATLNPDKTIGPIPGIEVGQQFLSRAEMVVIGLHHHWLNGIDYIGVCKGRIPYDLPIAVSIVMSGGYEDDVDNSEDVVYTGQGGNDLLSTRKQVKDQKMEKGNLALKNSMKCKQPVRVIRGHDDKRSYSGKVYTYDGLYEVCDMWAEKGISGFTVFKYKLRRCAGQPVLTTEQVKFARGKVAPKTIADLRGLVCNDISNGQEKLPVPASNTVDDPPVPPTDYTYITKTIVSNDIPKPLPPKGCKCKGKCTDEETCACARKNGKTFPYVFNHGGRLVQPMDVVYECGPGCGCGPECLNRTSQQGLQFRLEVYKTASKGWACRSWDFIPAGAVICEYFGTLRRNDANLESMLDNHYIFELDLFQTMRGMEGRQKRIGDVVPELSDHEDLMQEGPLYVLDAGKTGNVSRFLNHSCEPNVFIQCVLSDHGDHTQPRIVMFAADNIHPLEELCYDYGYAMDSVVAADGTIKQMPCHCGAPSCHKRMY